MRSRTLTLIILFLLPVSAIGQYISGLNVRNTDGQKLSGSILSCDTVFSFPTIHDWSGGLCDDGNFLYTIAHDSCKLMKYTYTGTPVDSFLLPTASYPTAGDITFDGNNLWIVIEQDSKVVKVDPNTGSVLKSFTINATTDVFGCAYDDGDLWITDYAQEMLYRVDTISGAILNSFNINAWVLPLEVVNGRLFGIDFTQNSAGGPMALIEIDKSNGTIISSTPWCLPYSLGLTRYTGDTWGLSSGLIHGLARIFKFENTLLSYGIEMTYQNDFMILPNPTTGQFTIQAITEINTSRITILDDTGRTVYDLDYPGPLTLDLSGHSSGIYLIRLYTDHGVRSHRIVLYGTE
jgi:hypothetical protein